MEGGGGGGGGVPTPRWAQPVNNSWRMSQPAAQPEIRAPNGAFALAKASAINGLIGAGISAGSAGVTTAAQGKWEKVPSSMLSAAGPGFVGGALSNGLLSAGLKPLTAGLAGGGGAIGTAILTTAITGGSPGEIIGAGSGNAVATALSLVAGADPEFKAVVTGVAFIYETTGNAAGATLTRILDGPE